MQVANPTIVLSSTGSDSAHYLRQACDAFTFLPRLVFSVIVEIVSVIFFAIIGVFTNGERFNPSSLDPKKPTILFINGLCHNPTAALFLRMRLGSKVNIYSYSYASYRFWHKRNCSIADYTRSIQAKVDKLKKETNGPVKVVAHSMGGLIALGLKDVKEMTLIGTPARGSWAARICPIFRVIKEMQPGSTYVETIRQSAEERIRSGDLQVRVHSSSMDALVRPHSTRIKGAEEISYNYLGHVGLLLTAGL